MFDEIASDWAKKRSREWKPFVVILEPRIEKWGHYFTNERDFPFIFIDLGCGSGRHSDFFQNHCKKLIDLDESREMLKKNRSKSIKIQAQMDSLPFRNSSFDGIFSIASLHHLRSLKERHNTIMEINRIGRRNALVSITVWRFYQKKFLKQFLEQLNNSFDIKDNSEIGDVIVPWIVSQKGGEKKIERFYHLFRVVEFRRLMSKFEKIHKSTMGKGKKKDNFIFIGRIAK
ncbi:class I SAM-dependent methyltransferase [Promethearchaeum syntrophicum]|uniref:Class I SAM-dependent methyltransferase n=1 Tax=Promethearchaeum syntrophicum TaxID=2594042 RepID=A0A5B9DBG3_9ARCH|nr:class I SAM-dependent methyltransferase [Candidatus Prometheoarchaeum syntrophicum]QEE16474.1 hypothetical protein DSAG12_02304 [Candidatus Prometheoarchaeum syntrophicum]